MFRWNPGSLTDARAWSVVFSVLASTLLALFYLAARVGFSNSTRPVAEILGLAFFVLATPFVVHLATRRNDQNTSWAGSESFVAIVLLALTGIAGWLTPRVGLNPFPLLALAGFISAVWIVVRQFLRGNRRSTFWFIVATVVLTFWIAGVEWANGFLNPLLVENLLLYGGSSHVDTWYLGSLANMIQLHGFPSVGLDGTPHLAYHFGSNWLFAQLATLTNLSIVDFYQLGMPVVMVPFFFRAIITCAHDIRAAREETVQRSLYNSPLLWVIIATATVGALPAAVLHSAGVWASGPILSESYTVAIALCLLFIGTVAVFARNASSNLSAATFYILFVPISLGTIGVAKISQLLLLLAVGAWIVIRYSLWKKPLPVASVLITSAVTWVIYNNVMAPGRSTGIEIFAFLHQLPAAWWVFFPLLHLFWSWVYTVLRFREEGIQTFGDFKTAFKTRSMIDVEVVLVVALAGVVPGLLVNIPNGNAYYFSDFQRWVSLALLLGSASLLATLGGWSGALHKNNPGTKPFARVLLLIAVAPFAFTLVTTSLGWGVRFIQADLNTRREVQQAVGTRPASGVFHGVIQAVRTSVHGHPVTALRDFRDAQISPLSDRAAIQRALVNSPRYSIVNTLQQVATLPSGVRRESILFIQPDVTVFWGILSHAQCIYSPLVAPAISGVPLLEGIPPHCVFPSFVLGDGYPQTDHWATPSDAPDSDVCTHAVKKGFKRVIRISPAGNDKVSMRAFTCVQSSPLRASL